MLRFGPIPQASTAGCAEKLDDVASSAAFATQEVVDSASPVIEAMHSEAKLGKNDELGAVSVARRVAALASASFGGPRLQSCSAGSSASRPPPSTQTATKLSQDLDGLRLQSQEWIAAGGRLIARLRDAELETRPLLPTAQNEDDADTFQNIYRGADDDVSERMWLRDGACTVVPEDGACSVVPARWCLHDRACTIVAAALAPLFPLPVH